ncbi:hypothetical protein [Chitinophaga defluvii]|uniref:Flavoprotein n=1 Tax=Chitinophaga defluvii TaxID=3163343 RepID=A0ABV2T916_9BACT
MNRLSLVVLMTTVLFSCAPRKDTYRYHVTKANTANHQFKQLLIVSAGSMANRKVAQDLKYALDKSFRKIGVTTAYEHLGNAEFCTPENVKIAAGKYPHDAVFVITPLSVANAVMIPVYNHASTDFRTNELQSVQTTGRAIDVSYQTSTFSLFDDADYANPYWTANVDLSINLAAEKVYDKLAAGLLKTWKTEGIVAGSVR